MLCSTLSLLYTSCLLYFLPALLPACSTSRLLYFLPRWLYFLPALLPNAEVSEDEIQHVVGGDASGDAAQAAEG